MARRPGAASPTSSVLSGADPASGLDEGELLITVSYTLIDTQAPAAVTVEVI